MNIQSKIVTVGSWVKVQIVSVTEGFAQTLKDGKWVNTTSEPQRFEDEILTLGKHFSNSEEAEQFTKSKFFKSILKQTIKFYQA